MKATRRILILVWFVFALLRLNAQDDPLRQYNAEKLSIQLQETFAGFPVGGMAPAPVVGKNDATWFAFKGFDPIRERDFYTLTDRPELAQRYDEYARQRSAVYWAMGGMAAAGVIMVVTAAYVWPSPGASEYPYSFGLGTGGGGVGTFFSVLGLALIPASLLALLRLPPERAVNYPAALDIAEEYNHGLRVTLHIAE